MGIITTAWIESQREIRYHRTPERRVQTLDEAKAFLSEVGFCHLWPIQGIEMTSLFHAIAGRLNALRLPGVTFRPCAFTPTFDKWQGRSCEGAFLHVTDREAFRPLLTGIAVIQACHDLGGEHFAWRADAYEFVRDVPAFDLLCGTDQVRLGIEAGWPLERLVEGFDEELRAFAPLRARYALYE